MSSIHFMPLGHESNKLIVSLSQERSKDGCRRPRKDNCTRSLLRKKWVCKCNAVVGLKVKTDALWGPSPSSWCQMGILPIYSLVLKNLFSWETGNSCWNTLKLGIRDGLDYQHGTNIFYQMLKFPRCAGWKSTEDTEGTTVLQLLLHKNCQCYPPQPHQPFVFLYTEIGK